jgi:hypothetical protein
MRQLLLLALIALLSCTKSPELLEQTELPDTAFSWSTVSITSKGVRQTHSVQPQNLNVALPQIRLRFGSKNQGLFKTKAVLSVFAPNTTTATGTATLTLLDGQSFEPLIASSATGAIHQYTGDINSLGTNLRTFQANTSTRPCVRVVFNITTNTGSTFTRTSPAPICPDVPPLDLAIALKTPIKRIYQAPEQQITLRLNRPTLPDNPLRGENLEVTLTGATDLETKPFLFNALCTTTDTSTATVLQNKILCPGSLSTSSSDPRVMDLNLQFNATNSPASIQISATYTSQAVETALSNNTTSATLPVLEPPNADLSVTWNTPSQITIDTTTPISITVQNYGTATSTARKLTANVGNGAVLSRPTNCGLSSGGSSFNCVVPPIVPNGTHTLTWTTNYAYAQTLYLETTVYGNNTDFDVYNNNSASARPQVIHDPATVTDLSVSLTATPDPPQSAIGQQYTVTVQNTSSIPATFSELQFSSGAGVEFSAVGCGFFYYGSCSLGTIAAGASRVITFTSTTTPNQAYESVQAYVNTSSPESDPNNNSASLSATFPSADMALVLSNSPEPVTPALGQQHTLTVQNIGVLAGSASLEIFAGSTPDFSINHPDCAWEAAGYRYVCNFASLEPGQTQSITLTRTTALTDTSFSVYATVYTSNDTDQNNNNLYQDWQFEP